MSIDLRDSAIVVRSALLAGVLFLGMPQEARAGLIYTMIDVPGAQSTAALGINNRGQIVGQYTDGTKNHGFLYDGSNYITIDPPWASESSGGYAGHINNSGQIVGNNPGAFFYSGGTYTPLTPPGAVGAAAWGINASGQIVGSYYDGTRERGYLYSGGTYTTLDPPGAVNVFIRGINDNGQVVGSYFDSASCSAFCQHGFIYQGGLYTLVDAPGAQDTELSDINASGVVIGGYSLGSISRAFLFDGTTYSDIPLPGASGRGMLINNRGDLMVQTSTQEFFYDGSGFIAIDVPVPGSFEPHVFDMNAHGQLVGYYFEQKNVATGFQILRGFLATPTPAPEPPALVLFGAGMFGLIALLRCRQAKV